MWKVFRLSSVILSQMKYERLIYFQITLFCKQIQ